MDGTGRFLVEGSNNEIPISSYVFECKDIILNHQGTGDKSVEINTRSCIDYLTEKADPKEILKDSLLTIEKDLWWKMGHAYVVVDLFDCSKWDGVNYEPLVDLVHQKVATHPLHQQRYENYVQMAALTASTNVGEGCCTHRSNARFRVMRGFNHEASHDASKTRGKKGKMG